MLWNLNGHKLDFTYGSVYRWWLVSEPLTDKFSTSNTTFLHTVQQLSTCTLLTTSPVRIFFSATWSCKGLHTVRRYSSMPRTILDIVVEVLGLKSWWTKSSPWPSSIIFRRSTYWCVLCLMIPHRATASFFFVTPCDFDYPLTHFKGPLVPLHTNIVCTYT